MRKLALSLAAAALLAATVPVVDAAAPQKVRVLAKDNFFKPSKVKVRKGGKVVWRWRGSNAHNVAITKPGGSTVVKRSPVKTKGKYASRFRRTGTWNVLCEIHPRTMTMKVVVRRLS